MSKWFRLYTKQTRAERLMEGALARLGVPVRFQHIVWKYILDFAIINDKIAIECDGPEHRRADRKIRDDERTHWLQKQGWKVVRIDNDDIYEDPVGALNRAMERAGLPYRIEG